MRSAAKRSTFKRFLVDGIQAVQTRLNRRGKRATKDWDKSVDRWRRVLDRLGEDAPVTAYLSLSRAQQKQGNLEAAESTIARARELHPTNIDLEVQFSELAMAKEAWRLAVTRWRALLDSLGGAAPPKAFARLSDAYRNLGLLQDADATLEEGLKLHPNDTNLMIAYAENSMAQQDWAIAAQRWTALLAADEVGVPPLVFSRLTKAYRGLGDFAAADKTTMRGLHLHPDNLQIAVARAEVAMTQADWSEAIKRWGALLNRPDVKPQIFSALSTAYRNSGKFELAHATIERAFKQFPGNQALAVEHANIATTQKNWPEAIKRWRKVLETYGDSREDAHMKLLVALASAGDNEAAQIAFSHFQSVSVDKDYDQWIKTRDKLDDNDRSLIREHADSFSVKPKFSILMPVYNTRADHLRCAIKSIMDQLYSNWELCIVDDASTKAEIREIIDEASKDSRIRPVYRKKNGGIAVCTNTALKMASGDWIVLMDHDDTLSEHALYLIAEAVNRDEDLSLVYSDEDTIDAAGHSLFPNFKPDWDYDLFLGQNFINHLTAYRADLVRKVGGFREGTRWISGLGSRATRIRVQPQSKNSPCTVHSLSLAHDWRKFLE